MKKGKRWFTIITFAVGFLICLYPVAASAWETRCLNEEAIHSQMITKLLVYMICNKNHIVTLEQLTEALWTDEKSENPYGALKNMMYRLRGTLRKVWPVKRGSCLLYEGCHGTDEKPGAPQSV